MIGNAKRRPVFVAGIGQTGPVSEDPRSIPEMALDAVERALDDAALGFDEIDAIVTASVDLFDGLTASNIAVTEVVGAVMKPETRIAADGLCAVIHAACQLWAEAYDKVLVVAHGKASMARRQRLTEWAMDPIHLQPLGIDFLACAGLQARAVAEGDENATRRWAEVAARRRQDAGEGGIVPYCSAEEILDSPVVASPLREKMCAPLGDAACAIVLCGDELGTDTSTSIEITGVGHDLSPHSLGERNLGEWESLRRACERACGLAGIEDPASAFDLLEPSCLYPHEEELFLKALGAKDNAALSPTGGLFAGTAPVAAGLSRLVAAAEQMRQPAGPKKALVHGAWGPAGQGQAVTIIERAS
jgi:hypothetical protein